MKLPSDGRVRPFHAACLSALCVLAGAAPPTAAAGGKFVAMLIPENTIPRFEQQDAYYFQKNMRALAPDIRVEVFNANNDAATQQRQAEQALTKGADAIVIIGVDETVAGVVTDKAAASKVPVIAYDRMPKSKNVSFFVFDADMKEIGRRQAQWIVEHTKPGDTIVQIKGSPGDPNMLLIDQGYQEVLAPLYKSGQRKLGHDAWAQNWDASIARRNMDQALTKLDNKVQAVLASNDGNAAAVIAALREQGLAGKVPVTGLDCTVQAIQLVLTGQQGMSLCFHFHEMGAMAAKVAIAAARGQSLKPYANSSYTNSAGATVPTALMQFSVVQGADDVRKLIERDEKTSRAAICTGAASKTPFCAQ